MDRSANAIAQASVGPRLNPALSLRQVAAEDFELRPGEAPYDIACGPRRRS
jgi:hypothetical protein